MKNNSTVVIWSLAIFIFALWLFLFLIPYSQYSGSIHECMIDYGDVSEGGYEYCLEALKNE